VLSWLLAVAGAVCPGPDLPADHVVDPDVVDEAPPGIPVLEDVTVGVEPAPGCDGCPPFVVFDVVLGATEDDTTPPEAMGYVLRVRDGDLPAGIELPEAPFAGPAATFRIPAPAEAFDADIAVQIELRAVDGAGNVSTRGLVVDVRTRGGASCAHAPAAGALAPIGLLALLARRPRRLRHGVAAAARAGGTTSRRG
jgi:hypothetical protein